MYSRYYKMTTTSESDPSDSQASSDESNQNKNIRHRLESRNKFNNSNASNDSLDSYHTKTRIGDCEALPPLGFFWDIENCQVPKNISASAVVQKFRDFFLDKHREVEFLVVCDVKKEHPQIIQELHDSQVNLIHVASISKNAADEKLRQLLRRFAEIYLAPAAVVLISGDINFAADLSDLRYRRKLHVILVHNINVADALLLCANEHYYYSFITNGLPVKNLKGKINDSAFLLVCNLPTNICATIIKNRLNFLCNNCGGRVINVNQEEGSAYLRFSNQDAANRAQKRIQGEDVFGNRIKAVTPSLRCLTGAKVKGQNASKGSQMPSHMPSYDSFRSCSVKDTKKHLYDDGLLKSGGTTSMSLTDAGVRPKMYGGDFSHMYANGGNMDISNKIGQPVDLIISNLDPTINLKELRRLLINMLKEFTMVSNINLVLQTDATPIANIRVSNQQAAQFIISQLHRQKLGHKRIVISYAQDNSPEPEQLKAMVVSVLQEVPDNVMPLFKFIELLESRYHCTISVSDVNKLKDICKITENMGSRVISFTPQMKSLPPANLLNKHLVPYCTTHCPNGLPNIGWCELNTVQSRNVTMPLKQFMNKLDRLLTIHMGSFPLLSFQACYEQECQESLPIDDNGVPLEHLISCVPNVEIKFSGPTKNIKLISKSVRYIEMDEELVLKSVPPSLAPNISLLSRELVDLLKTTDKCQLLLNKFIPAYHHHFGRQCHVADYGYTKLIDLFEAMPHVIQIMGDGVRKIITLSHQAQMRRFTSDLLRVLKVQPSKQILLDDFKNAYEKVLNKSFNPVDYGLCTFQDLLEEVPENVIVVTSVEHNVIISVPKREQTAKEIMKTKQFAMEVIDILKHSPNFTMLFNKFVPAYHHHFGHQCRVSDYGFSKLIELFEAIPDVVIIGELVEGERMVSLTLQQSLRVLSGQILSLIKNSVTSFIALDMLSIAYLKEFGYPLKPQRYDCTTILELIKQLSVYIQIAETVTGPVLLCADNDTLSLSKIKCWALLLKSPHCKELSLFKDEHQARYNRIVSMNDIKQLQSVVSIATSNKINYIALTDMYKLAAQLYHVLYSNGGSILFNDLERLYFQMFGQNLKLSDYNIPSVDDLYDKFGFLFFTCTYKKDVLALNRNLAEYHIPLPVKMSSVTRKWSHPLLQQPTTSLRKISPPKPDTPPTPTNNPWNSSRDIGSDLNLSIQLPIIENPQLLGNPYDLISPAKQLFPANRNIWGRPPEPNKLPKPDKLIMKNSNADDSTDSGFHCKFDGDMEYGAFGKTSL